MEKTYKIRAIRRAWVQVVADETVSQDEIYELAKEKVKKGKPQWEEPSFNIVEISIDDSVTSDIKTKVTLPKNSEK
jgi:hypothetical protein